MKRIELPFLKFYEEKLELKWKIAYFLTEGEITARIFSDPHFKIHEIRVPVNFYLNPNFYLHDLVHELCHARLAERIDPIFSGAIFRKKYLQSKDFQKFATMLYFSQLHVDIWANDERHHFFPDLTFRDLKTFCISLFEILRKIRSKLRYHDCTSSPTC